MCLCVLDTNIGTHSKTYEELKMIEICDQFSYKKYKPVCTDLYGCTYYGKGREIQVYIYAYSYIQICVDTFRYVWVEIFIYVCIR